MASSANFPIGKNKFMREEVELSNNMQENDVWRKDQCYQLFKVEFSFKTYFKIRLTKGPKSTIMKIHFFFKKKKICNIWQHCRKEPPLKNESCGI